MQSGEYGAGVSDIQQFMVDGGCPSSLFSISTSPPNANSSSSSAAAAEIQKFHQLAPHPHHLQAPPQHFAHFGHPISITQQLFQQTHHPHHPFQLVHHQLRHQHQHQQHHLGLEQDQSGQENSNSPAGPQSFLAAMNFKLGVNESSGGSRDGLNEDDAILHGDDGSESRLHHHHHHHNLWHREEESAAAAVAAAAAAAAGNIKQPFWRPLDIDFINPNNKRPAKDKQPAAGEMSSSNIVRHFKKSSNESLDHNNQPKAAENAAATDSNYKLFRELEAICKPGGTPSGGGGGGCGGGNNTNQTGSGSALTGDDNPLMPAAAAPVPALRPDNISDTSNGGEAPQPLTVTVSKSSSGGRKKRSKRKQQTQLSSIAAFFETLVKQLMDHQEGLHRKFLEVMERRDQERTNREEAWRKQEAARANREAAARAQERALAASRESSIVAFLEKIAGESLVLQTKAQFKAQLITEEPQKAEHDDGGNAEAQNASEQHNADSANNNNAAAVQLVSSSRWPKAEVQALIQVRSGFETRFQEPGLKGPLWEEVSNEMTAMGYSRSAKRCKEKWENINKYFRKTKDNGKKRPQHSKTCPYFHQLDQLYSSTYNSKSLINSAAATPPSSSNANNANEAEQRMDNSELLDAIVVSNEPGKMKAVEIRDDEDGIVEGQGESHGDDDDRQGLLPLCGGGFHGLLS